MFCCPSSNKLITLPPDVCIQKWPIQSKSDGFANFVQRNMRCNCAQQQRSRPSAASTYKHYPITNWPQNSFHRSGGAALESFLPAASETHPSTADAPLAVAPLCRNIRLATGSH